MPVRKIPHDNLPATGSCASRESARMTAFQFLHQRDNTILPEFDANIERPEHAPATVPLLKAVLPALPIHSDSGHNTHRPLRARLTNTPDTGKQRDRVFRIAAKS
jgi:hypothetical protein